MHIRHYSTFSLFIGHISFIVHHLKWLKWLRNGSRASWKCQFMQNKYLRQKSRWTQIQSSQVEYGAWDSEA